MTPDPFSRPLFSPEAFTNECKWLIENPGLMKILPPNYYYYIKDTKTQKAWITEKDGKYTINEGVIKKWVDNAYGGYYKPDTLIEYKRDKTGRYIYEFGEKNGRLPIFWSTRNGSPAGQ